MLLRFSRAEQDDCGGGDRHGTPHEIPSVRPPLLYQPSHAIEDAM